MNRDDQFFSYLSKKVKLRKLRMITFGKNKGSDICLKKILKRRHISKVFINIKNTQIDFEIKDLNIYNILASIAILIGLNLDVIKNKTKIQKS